MVLDKLIEVVRATGRIGVVGVYNPQDPGAATEDAQQGRYGFNYGLMFDKAITMGHGQCPVKRYNYQLRDLKEELETHVPGVRVGIEPEKEDRRTYRVRFDRIEQLWGFRATRRVGDGIEEVARAVRSGVIADPRERRYYNA